MTCANAINGCDREPRPRSRYCARCDKRRRKGQTLDLRVNPRVQPPRDIPGLYGPDVRCPHCRGIRVASALIDVEEDGSVCCVRCAIAIHEREAVMA